MADKFPPKKFKEALLEAANVLAEDGCDEAEKLVSALSEGKVKPVVLEQLAGGVAVFLPKFRKNTNIAAIDWSQHLVLLQKFVEAIVLRLGL